MEEKAVRGEGMVDVGRGGNSANMLYLDGKLCTYIVLRTRSGTWGGSDIRQ